MTRGDRCCDDGGSVGAGAVVVGGDARAGDAVASVDVAAVVAADGSAEVAADIAVVVDDTAIEVLCFTPSSSMLVSNQRQSPSWGSSFLQKFFYSLPLGTFRCIHGSPVCTTNRGQVVFAD